MAGVRVRVRAGVRVRVRVGVRVGVRVRIRLKHLHCEAVFDTVFVRRAPPLRPDAGG